MFTTQGDRSPDTHKATKKKYYSPGIPKLFIVKPDGEMITCNGRADLHEVGGKAAWRYWKDGKGVVPPDSESEEEEEEGNEDKDGDEKEEKKEEEKEEAEEKPGDGEQES